MEPDFNSGRSRRVKGPLSIRGITGLLTAILFLCSSQLLTAASNETDTAVTDTATAGLSADRIIFNPADASLEYIGNVSITLGEIVITADNVKAFLKKGEDSGSSLSSGSLEKVEESFEELFEKIVAEGNVNIVFQNGVATGDEAVYDLAAQSSVLTGNPASLVVGGYTMTSPEITLNGSL